MKRTIFYLILLFTFGCNANNGWEIKTRYYNLYENPANARVETIFLMNGYMRMDNGDLITIFDLKKGEILYYNTSNKTYWQGKPERFNAEVKEELTAMIEKELLAIDEDKRDLTRKMYEEMLRSSFPEVDDEDQVPRKYTVRKIGDGEMVAGYKTQTFNILENGQLLEAIWVAPELGVASDFDFIGLSQFINQLARGAYAASFESSNEYFDLLKKGYPVRVEMVKSDGYTYVSDVVEAKRVKFTESHFKVPKGYTAASLTQVGVWQGYM
jgi:hypothetical protein